MNLAPDVAAAVEEIRRREGRGVSDVVNELARRGLSAAEPARTPFVQAVSSNGVPLIPLDDIAALAIEHGVAVASSDGDFARFSEIRWVDPPAG